MVTDPIEVTQLMVKAQGQLEHERQNEESEASRSQDDLVTNSESEHVTPVPKVTLDEVKVNKDDATIQHAIRIRNNLVAVISYQQQERYKPMLRQLKALRPTRNILSYSGLGILLNHMRLRPEPLRTEVVALSAD